MVSSKKKLMKKILKGIAITIIIYITLSLVSTKIIYDSVFRHYSAKEPQSIISENAQMMKMRKQFSYPCENGSLTGHLYYAPQCKQGLIVLVPGFRAESIEYEGVINALTNKGFDVFAFNPTGHGKGSKGSSVGYAQIIKDVNSTLNFIDKSEMFLYDNIYLLGHSRGGYGICCAMNGHGSIDAAVCINSTDTSMDAIMAYSTEYAGNAAYANYPFLSMYESILFGSDLSSSSAVRHINKSDIPIFVIQAQNDEHISKDKYSLYSKMDEITSKKAEFLLYNKNGSDGHTSILYDKNRIANQDIIDTIVSFYEKYSNEKE